MIYRSIIAGLWLLLIAYWAVAAVVAKRSASRWRWRREIGLRLIVILAVVALLQWTSLRNCRSDQHSASHAAILGWSGVALCLLGFGLAINAGTSGAIGACPRLARSSPNLSPAGPMP